MIKTKTVLTLLTYFLSLLGGASVFSWLDPLARVILISGFTAGIIADSKGRYYLRGLTPTLLSIGFFLFYLSRITGDNLVAPVMNLVIILLSVRLAGDKTERNCMQAVVLSLFVLAGSSLLSLDMMFLIYLVLFLVFVAVFLVFLSFHSHNPEKVFSRDDLKKILTVALAMPVISFPLLMVFFIILPRTQYPVWNFLNGHGRKVSGFSEQVEPGGSDGLGDMKTLAFRASSPVLDKKELYWRGIVLNSIRDTVWVRSEKKLNEVPDAGKGRVVRQTIYPEPDSGRYLIALNIPLSLTGAKAGMDPDCVYVRHRTSAGRVKYDTVSVMTDTLRIKGGIDREFYLQTPAGTSPRVVELARRISRQGDTDEEKLELLERYFVSSNLKYAKKNVSRPKHPTDEFLFEKRSGNCEYFATSFALLLRLMGIPSRLVGGYYGGDYNNVGGYYMVTDDDAHVWVEAYIEGKGWLTIDPTGFSSGFAQEVSSRSREGLSRFRMLADSIGYYWNLAIISYDMEKQVNIFIKSGRAVRMIRMPSKPWKLLPYMIPLLLLAITLIFRKRCRYISREEKIVRKFLKKIRRKYPGVEIVASTGLRDLAEKIDLAAVRDFTDIYSSAVYNDRKLNDSEYSELRRLIDLI